MGEMFRVPYEHEKGHGVARLLVDDVVEHVFEEVSSMSDVEEREWRDAGA
jgi:ethanolamine ammonia-lyase large subunit